MPIFAAPGYRLYYEWGNGFDPSRPTAVLLHDGLGAVGSWRGLPARLSENLNINTLVYDRFGYGRSQARTAFPDRFMEGEVPVLPGLLDHLGLDQDRVHLVGHSDGGSIALLFAGRYPDRVGAVVTEAAHVFVEEKTQAGIRDLVTLQSQGRTPGWLHKLHGERAESLLTLWSERWLTDLHAGWDIRSHLPAVRAPVLAVQGEEDEFGTQAQVDSILQGVAGSSSWIAPQCGHTPHAQAEDAFLEKVSVFLQAHL